MTLRSLVAPVLALIVSVLTAHAQQEPARKLQVLTDDRIWTSVAVNDLRVMMPAKPGDVRDEASSEVQSIHALTDAGTFSVIIKQLDKDLDARNTEILVNEVALAALTAKTTLLEKHDVEYEGSRGAQVTYLEDGNRVCARIFYLNDRLIVMSASFKAVAYRPELGIVIDQFFDSIRVKVPLLIA